MSLTDAAMSVTTATTSTEEKMISRDNKIKGQLSLGDDSTDADTENCSSDADSNHRFEVSNQPGSPAGSSASAKLPSLGSAGHFEGTCKRCCFFPKGRCSNGAECQFCHFDHEKRTRTNKKTKKINKETKPLVPQEMGAMMSPPGLEDFGPESESLAFSQLPQPMVGAATPLALAPQWATATAPPPAAAPEWTACSQPVLDIPSHGVPLKISLTNPFCPVVVLDRTIPAKKRVPAQYGTGDALHLNPTLPAKKRIPECLLAY